MRAPENSPPLGPGAGSVVLKFGGSALRDGEAVRHAVGLVGTLGGALRGERPLVVVSAHGGVTRMLENAVEEAAAGRRAFDPIRIRHRTLLRQLELPPDLLDRHLAELGGLLDALARSRTIDRVRRDGVLSFGERMSARVFAAAARRDGIEAFPVDTSDLDLVRCERSRELPSEVPPRLARSLASTPGVAVVTGFVVLDPKGHLTTLGRNGSDLTATWLGAALGAREVQLWKRVPGLMSADPALVPEARHLARVSWEEAGEMARHGSSVLHPASIEPARRAGACLSIRNFEDAEGPGSLVTDGAEDDMPPVRAVAYRADVALLRIPLGMSQGRSRELSALFSELTRAGVDPYLATIGSREASLLVTEDRWLEESLEESFPERVLTRGLASVTVVGRGLDADARVESALREAQTLGATRWRGDEGPSRVLLASRSLAVRLVRTLHERLFAS